MHYVKSYPHEIIFLCMRTSSYYNIIFSVWFLATNSCSNEQAEAVMILSIYQHVSKKNRHKNDENHPQNHRDGRKWNIIHSLILSIR